MTTSQSRNGVTYEERRFLGGGLLGTDLDPSAVVAELKETRANVSYLDQAHARSADLLSAVTVGEIALGFFGSVLTLVVILQWFAVRGLRRDLTRLTSATASMQSPRVGASS